MYDIFRERGNLATIFTPRDTELTPLTNHIEFSQEELAGLNAVVVEIQDVGARYFNYTKDVFRLMDALKAMKDDAPSMYVVDHNNPAGRIVEGTMPSSLMEVNVPKVAHRHGLTLGELANLYYHEIGAKFALHVISALATDSNHQLMPWTIAPVSDMTARWRSSHFKLVQIKGRRLSTMRPLRATFLSISSIRLSYALMVLRRSSRSCL